MINKILTRRVVSNVKFVCRYIFTSFRISCREMSAEINFVKNETPGVSDDLLVEFKTFIPKLTPNLLKGQCGRVGVVGGSLEYTGAPYFAAISALKLGADLVFVICCREAAPVIKSFSPELIVYPFLDDPQALQKIIRCLEKLDSLVIGPGLGRQPDVFKNVEEIIEYCSTTLKKSLPLIIDADGLYLITQKPNLVRDYKGPVILTPNVMEYLRLCQKLSVEQNDYVRVAEMLNCVLVMKNNMDIICNGINGEVLKLGKETTTITCSVHSSYRRCGGQGDILSGCTAAFVAWFVFKRYNGSIDPISDFFIENKLSIKETDSLVRENIYKDRYRGFSVACYAACCITRNCSRMGFEKYGRSMTASDMIPFIHHSFMQFFGE